MIDFRGRNYKNNLVQDENKLSKEVFCEEIRQHKLAFYKLAKSILRNEVDVEDAISETIVQGYAHREQLRENKKFKQWMMRILVNECYKILKRQKLIILEENLEKLSTSYNENFTVEEENEVTSAIEKLRPKLLMVASLYYYEELSVGEISEILNIPEGTVKSRLKRSREKLMVLLRERMEEMVQ